MTLWHKGVTGVGSLPGTDPAAAARLVCGELPIPHLPELPARLWYGDLAGRGAALLDGMSVDLQPSGWRLVPRPSRDGQRAKDLLSRDLDALEDEQPTAALIKVQATGPWTLAALVELQRGDKVLADHGAVRDLAQSLRQGLADHVADVARRFPHATIALQLDEPSLPAVLAARIPTSSGFGTLRAPDPQRARDLLRTVLGVAEHTVVHCCAHRPPIDLLAEAEAISVDAAMLDVRDDEALGTALERGTQLLLGTDAPTVAGVVEVVERLRDRVGLTDLTLTPSCGLAGHPDPTTALRTLVKAQEEL